MVGALTNLAKQSLTSSANQAAGAVAASAGKATSPGVGNSTSLGSASQVDISDRAKILYKQAQDNQVIADKLQSYLDEIKGNINNSGGQKATKADDNLDATQPASMQLLSKLQNTVVENHRQKDGTVSSYDVTLRDVSLAPKTQAEQDFWYKSDGAGWVQGASPDDSADTKQMIQAIKDRQITFIDASTVPDLNYHNKITIQGGEGGGAAGMTRTWNAQSAIFKDPSRGYFPMADGTLISWPKKAAS